MAGVFRFVFNKTIDYQWYKMVMLSLDPSTHLSTIPYLRTCLTSDKNEKGWDFLNEVDESVQRKAISCSHKSFLRWYDFRQEQATARKIGLIPKYIARKTEGMRFTTSNIKIFYDHIKVPKLGKIKLYEKGYIPQGEKVTKACFTHDGKDWWLAVEINSEKEVKKAQDLTGDLYADFTTDGSLITNAGTFKSVTSQPSYKVVSKRYDKIAKKLRRQKRANFVRQASGKIVVRTSRNMMKTRKALLKTANKLARIKSDYFRKVANKLAITKPQKVYLLSKDVIRHTRQDYLSRVARAAGVRQFSDILTRKLELQGTSVERLEYPSEFYRALGSRVCGEVFEYNHNRNCTSVKQELLFKK